MPLLVLLLVCQDRFLKDPSPQTAAIDKAQIKDAEAKADAGRAILRALHVALARAEAEKWTAETPEFKELKDYLAKFPPGKVDHAAAIEWLTQKPSPLKSLLAKAHLEEFSRTSVDKFAELAQKLGMTKLDDGRWATPEAVAVTAIREAKRAPDPTPPGSFEVGYVGAIQMIRGDAKFADIIKFVESLKKFGQIPHLEAMIAALKRGVPCKKCDGTSSLECSSCKGAGERTAQCNACEGTGQVYKGVSGTTRKAVYIACTQCGAKGTWQVQCTECKGNKHLPCSACKAPYKRPGMKDLFGEELCAFCAGKGLVQTRAVDVCPFCRGLGWILEPRSDPSKVLTPVQ